MIRGERRHDLRTEERRSRVRTPGKLKFIEDVTYTVLRRLDDERLDKRKEAGYKDDRAAGTTSGDGDSEIR